MEKCIRFVVGIALAAAMQWFVAASSSVADEKSAAKEKELLETLRSGAPAEKAMACKQLTIHGGTAAVPELAKLLSDEQLASWARIALEAIPDASAGEALRHAAESLQGKLLVGALNSIGVRRDAGAVVLLAKRLKDQDNEVASAAAVALGRVGNDAATRTLREALTGAPAALRDSIAEGCILCAEQLLAGGKAREAAELYDQVRKAEVTKQKVVEATRGAIVARGADGIPLLVEQLRSDDKTFFRIGLSTSRELAGREVADAIAGEVTRTSRDRAALLLSALADRKDGYVPEAIVKAAKSGAAPLRVAAINALGRAGEASALSTILEAATDKDAEVVSAAKAALIALPGEKVNAEIAARLAKADGKSLVVLIEAAGQRRVPAEETLIKSLDHREPEIRRAALAALGETVGPKNLSVLIARVIGGADKADAQSARAALKAACIRMPDREATAAQLAAALPRASADDKAILLEILGEMGGKKALDTIAAAVRSGDEKLQDAGSRLLGEWLDVDAAPVLLDLAKTASSDKYQVRALRGYIRLARQFAKSDEERARMCQIALEAARRPEEQKLVLGVLQSYPSVETLKVALAARETTGLKDDATRTAMAIAQRIGGKNDVRKFLADAGVEPVKLEIIKAEYGAGSNKRDVTKTLQQRAGELPLIVLPKPTFNDSFGGDPAPGTPKQLTIHYRLNGKAADASFAENAAILLPMPK
jgi:HEAT repeat protein